MATADELLAGLSAGDDTTLVIDNYLRTINIPKTITNLGVEHDDEVLTLNFKMPRYLDDTDLSTFSIRINYINANGDSDAYTINDNKKTIGPDSITFSWLVGPTATAYKGMTKFIVCMKTLKSDGTIDREYNTTIAALPVLEGLEVDEQVITQYSDILEQWKRELFGIGDTEEASMRAVSQKEQENIVQKGAEVLATIPEEYQETAKAAQEGVRTKADAIVCTTQGETITVRDSSDDHLRGLRVFGRTTQATTLGRQLFNAKNCEGVGSNNTIQVSDDEYTITAYGGVSAGYGFSKFPLDASKCAGKTLIMSADSVIGASQCGVMLYGLINGASVINYTLKPGDRYIECPIAENVEEVKVYVYSNTTGTPLTSPNTIIVRGLMVSYAESPWEPYSGGYISPSPEWSQEMKSIDNVEPTILGKNLLNWKASSYYNNGRLELSYTSYNSIAGGLKKIRVYPGRTYTFSYKYEGGDRVIFSFLDIDGNILPDIDIGWGTYLALYYGRYGEVGDGATFTIPATANRVAYVEIHLCQMNTCGAGNYNYYTDLQFEEGSVPTEYEAYKDPITIPTAYTLRGIPVTSGGNYTDSNGQQWLCDEIDFERGVYVQKVASLVLDGSTDEQLRKNADADTSNYLYYAYVNNIGDNYCLCDKLAEKSSNITSKTGQDISISGISVSSKYGVVYINIGYLMTENTLDHFRTCLSENPLTVIYPIKTPIETPLTTEELAAFKALRSNYPSTTIFNDVGAMMELTYNADTKTYVENGIQRTVTEVMEAIENGSY